MDEPTVGSSHESGENPQKAATTRRPRATNKEMLRRENSVVALIVKNGTVDAYIVSDALGISYAQTVTLLAKMVSGGKIQRLGLNGKKAVFGFRESAPRTKPLPLKSVDHSSVLDHFRLGAQVEVVGLSRHEDSSTHIELEADGERFQVSLVA